MLWFDSGRVPPGRWPFLGAAYASLRELEESLAGSVDLTEGNDGVTITGCLEAYRQAILRRALDLAQAIIASWNAGQLVGAVVCARALLETLATFHSLLHRAQTIADSGDWEAIGRLVDGYAFSGPPNSRKVTRSPESPPSLRQMVRKFIENTQPGKEMFWDQVCEEAHPNGKRMMSFGGDLREQRFDARSAASNEIRLFPAIYNCIYSCCWLFDAMLDFEILCEHIRSGAPLPDNHPLVQEKAQADEFVESCLKTASS